MEDSRPKKTPDPVTAVPSRAAGPGRNFPQIVLATLAGLAMGLVATIAVLRTLNRDSTPELTPAIFHAEHARAKAAEPPDYDIEVRVTGSQPATYRARVRGGQAQAAWRNGQPLTSRRTFGTWSISGMFSTISRDIEAVERHAAGQADRGLPPLILRAAFDPKYHFPARYRRTEWGSRKGTTAQEVTWEVTSFNAKP